MSELLLIVTTWVHLISAVVWIGGIFFILYVALPAAKQAIEQPGKIMGPISKRYVPMANISIVLIIVSGIIMSFASHNVSGLIALSSLWTQSLFVKVLIVCLMACIHFYRGLLLTPGIARLTSEGGHAERIEKLQRLSLTLVNVNFILGTVVLLLTSVLYAHKA